MLLAMLLAALLAGRMAPPQQAPPVALRQLLAKKTEAVRSGNQQLLLRILDPTQTKYRQEQLRWFQDAQQSILPASFSLQIALPAVKRIDAQTMVVWVEESYRLTGNRRRVRIRYPLRAVSCPAGLCDAGLALARLPGERVLVQFSSPHLLATAQKAQILVEQLLTLLARPYRWQPAEVVVALYDRYDWFYQSIKPSLPAWAVGWHEADQSIKLICPTQDYQANFLFHGLAHELTHQMVSELTADNAAYWLQEGAAMYYERQGPPAPNLPSSATRLPLLPWLTSQPPLFTWQQLEQLSLENLGDEAAASYYRSCYHWFAFLVRSCGEARLQKLFAQLRRFPILNADAKLKQTLLNQRTRQAAQLALGIPLTRLAQQWQLYEERRGELFFQQA